ADSKGMAALYLTLEAAGIGGSVYFHQKGMLSVGAYEQYADNHWSVSKWLDHYNPLSDPTTHTATVYVDNRSYSPQIQQSYEAMKEDIQDGYRTLTIVRDYHFYENIGKYEQFKAGWDDWAPGTEDPGDPLSGIYPTFSENQSLYALQRRAANDLLKIGGYFGTALFFNHFIAAIDAGLRIRYLNEKHGISYSFFSAPLIGNTGLSGIRGGINVRF
ncbi:MAG: hypothetical protein RBT66_09825, partial [bacterium]|nr:hypothetical protein [bacterium]